MSLYDLKEYAFDKTNNSLIELNNLIKNSQFYDRAAFFIDGLIYFNDSEILDVVQKTVTISNKDKNKFFYYKYILSKNYHNIFFYDAFSYLNTLSKSVPFYVLFHCKIKQIMNNNQILVQDRYKVSGVFTIDRNLCISDFIRGDCYIVFLNVKENKIYDVLYNSSKRKVLSWNMELFN